MSSHLTGGPPATPVMRPRVDRMGVSQQQFNRTVVEGE